MTAIDELRNLGPKTALWLRRVGITNDAELAAAGAAEAFVRLRDAGMRPSKVALWALQGALMEIDWRELPGEVKQRLVDEVERLEAS